MRSSAPLLVVVLALAFATEARATVTATYDPVRRTLGIESDGADNIAVGCSGGQTTVNGLPPTSGPLRCGEFVRLVVHGGPGANRIDLSGALVSNDPGSKGVTASASVMSGAGDDAIVGPPGSVRVRLDGGHGSDRIEGRAYDTYVFGTASGTEVDTIVEPGSAACNPTYFDTDLPNVSWWTVPWDALDFSALGPEDGVIVSLAAPGGIVASHGQRAVRLESRGAQPLDAVSGGAGNDVIAGACMTDGQGGDDRVTGSPTGDLLVGGKGDDVLAGAEGRDALDGGTGRDTLKGGTGADKLVGGAGDDSIAGGADGDVYLFTSLDGGQTDAVSERPTPGIDVLSLDYGRTPLRADLGAGGTTIAVAAGTRIVTAPGGSRNFEGVIGGAGNDVLLGHDGANHFWGGGGIDHAVGRRGNDVYHLDWAASMPQAAYGAAEFWLGPIDRGTNLGRFFDKALLPPARLRVVERRGGGRDTLDLGEGWLSVEGHGARLEGQIRSGARVDLSGAGPLVRAGKVSAVSGAPDTAANLENVRGTTYDDRIVGNAAANVLEGRQGRDRISGGVGGDTCLVSRSEDVLRGCERVRVRDPDR